MLSFYNWKLSFRNLTRQSKSTILNITGLAIGFAAVILLSVYAYREFNYDTFHKDAERIFKPEFEIIKANDDIDIASNLTIEQIKDFQMMIPGIETISFLNYSRWDWDYGAWIEYNSNKFNLPFMAFTDEYFPDIFSFDVYAGDLKETLKNPNQIVLTKDITDKIFGHENPIGKEVLLNKKLTTIGAVLNKIPSNSSIQFSGLVNYKSASTFFDGPITDYSNIPFLVTKDETAVEQMGKTMSEVLYTNLPDEVKQEFNPTFKTTLIPITDLYYHPSGHLNPIKQGNKNISYALLFIGTLILILAIINYNNLLLAVSIKKKREIGIHQVFGAGNKFNRNQFLIRGGIISTIAFIASIPIFYLSLPWFNHLVVYPIQKSDFLLPQAIVITISLLFATILLSGLLPSFFQKNKNLINQVKLIDETNPGKGNSWRQGLVIFQLFISISLLAISIVIAKQINYGMTKDLGFTTENVIMLNARKLGNKSDDFIHSINNNSQTLSHCLSTRYLENYNFWGGEVYEPNSPAKSIEYAHVRVNHSFLETLQIDILEGRNFSEEIPSDINKCIVNKAFIDQYGIDNPLSANIEGSDIIGVVENFNYNSLHDKIEPLRLWYTPGNAGLSSFRFRATNKKELASYISFLKTEWQKHSTDAPFEYTFLDDRLRSMYEEDIKLAQSIISFSVIAILIACLGILGLLSFVVENKVKEIGIRKVNGAKIYQIIQLINFDLIKWTSIASIISIPISWYIANKWLENFAYKTEISWWIFALAGVSALFIALLTVSWNSFRAANKNPVEALRYE